MKQAVPDAPFRPAEFFSFIMYRRSVRALLQQTDRRYKEGHINKVQSRCLNESGQIIRHEDTARCKAASEAAPEEKSFPQMLWFPEHQNSQRFLYFQQLI